MDGPYNPFSIIKSKSKFPAKIGVNLRAPISEIYQEGILDRGINLEVDYWRMREFEDGLNYIHCYFIDKDVKSQVEKEFISNSTKTLEEYGSISLMINEETLINDFALISNFKIGDLDIKKGRHQAYALEKFTVDSEYNLPFDEKDNLKIKETWKVYKDGLIPMPEFINRCLDYLNR